MNITKYDFKRIFLYAHLPSLLHLCSTNKSTRISCNDETLWRDKLLKDYTDVNYNGSIPITYKELYINRYNFSKNLTNWMNNIHTDIKYLISYGRYQHVSILNDALGIIDTLRNYFLSNITHNVYWVYTSLYNSNYHTTLLQELVYIYEVISYYNKKLTTKDKTVLQYSKKLLQSTYAMIELTLRSGYYSNNTIGLVSDVIRPIDSTRLISLLTRYNIRYEADKSE
jgi:hypothetical protein